YVVDEGGVRCARRGKQAPLVRRVVRFPRQWIIAFDYLEQRLLFAEEGFVGACDEVDFVIAEQSFGSDLREGALETPELFFEGGLRRNVEVERAKQIGGDQHPLEGRVRISTKQEAILEGARLAFCGVADHSARRARMVLDGLPLDARRKPGPPSATKTRTLH